MGFKSNMPSDKPLTHEINKLIHVMKSHGIPLLVRERQGFVYTDCQTLSQQRRRD
jgi:hypothetical protein